MEEIYTLAAVVILVVILLSASMHDLRSREVPDIHWAAICAVGIVMMIISILDGTVTVQRIMILIGSIMIIADILYDRDLPQYAEILFYGTLAVMFMYPVMTAMDDTFVVSSLAIPICYLLFVVLFFGGMIKGGADVKCLISLAIIFPMYPVLYGYPIIGVPEPIISSMISFPLAVLLYASLFSLILMVPLVVRNIRLGDTRFPNMLIGYRMRSEDVEGHHVWPMGDGAEEDGKVWVTPKIPFIIPITAAVVFTMFVGNLIFLI